MKLQLDRWTGRGDELDVQLLPRPALPPWSLLLLRPARLIYFAHLQGLMQASLPTRRCGAPWRRVTECASARLSALGT